MIEFLLPIALFLFIMDKLFPIQEKSNGKRL
jgi:hypothetical protein